MVARLLDGIDQKGSHSQKKLIFLFLGGLKLAGV